MSSFAAFKQAHRRTVRAPVNPYDKCTVVSIYPKDIHEHKITLTPSEYYIGAGSFENPALSVIGPASWWRDVGENEPLLEITHSAPVMADSLLKDYMNGLIGCNMIDTHPGLYWLPSEVTLEEVTGRYRGELEKANVNQTRYYQSLIKMADTLWARTNGNPLSIPEDAKMACRELQQEREWTAQFAPREISKCPACGTIRNIAFPMCPNCKTIIDMDAFKKLNLKIAE